MEKARLDRECLSPFLYNYYDLNVHFESIITHRFLFTVVDLCVQVCIHTYLHLCACRKRKQAIKLGLCVDLMTHPTPNHLYEANLNSILFVFLFSIFHPH